MSQGRARRDVIVSLCPDRSPIVDVGADHGRVAQALGAIPTERMPRRMGRRGGPWVVADGLGPFREVAVAVIAGMGARTIAGILERGPRPEVAVLHAQDDPPRLRRWLAAHSWRIDAEALAPEAGRFAEVVRAVPGREPATGARLELGPVLLEGDDPWLCAHLEQLRRRYRGLLGHTVGVPDRHACFAARLACVEDALARRIGAGGGR